MAFSRTASWLLVGALGALGCGSDGRPGPGSDGGNGTDAAPPDAGDDGASPDGSTDAGGPMRGLDCVIAPDDQAVEPVSPRSDRSFALSVRGNRVEAIWTLSGCGQPGRRMRRLSFDTADPVPAGTDWLDDDACVFRQNPALLHYADPLRDGEVVLEAFYAARDSGRVVPTMHGIEPSSEAQPLPQEGREARDARGLSATLHNGRAVLAWVGALPEESADQGRDVLAQLVHFQNAPHVVLDASEGHRPDAVAIASMGSAMGDETHAAVAWASHAGGAAGGVFLASLDEGGTPTGSPEQLLTAGGASARVALTDHPQGGGALAYVVDFDDASAHVRLQLLDERARPTGRVKQITSQSLRARDVSVAPFGPGYVLAYRLLSPQAAIQPVVQLAFTDSGGLLIGTLDLASAEAAGGPTSVEVANDGRLVVAWVDTTSAGSRLNVWRGTCR